MDALAELERRYDGPIPKHLRAVALAGGASRLAVSNARAEMRVWKYLVRDTIACLKLCRLACAVDEPSRAARNVQRQNVNLAAYREGWKAALRRWITARRTLEYETAMHADIVAPLRRT